MAPRRNPLIGTRRSAPAHYRFRANQAGCNPLRMPCFCKRLSQRRHSLGTRQRRKVAGDKTEAHAASFYAAETGTGVLALRSSSGPVPQVEEGPDMSESRTTTDHDEIRRWAEERGGRPASVRGTGQSGDEASCGSTFQAPGTTTISRTSPGTRSSRSSRRAGWPSSTRTRRRAATPAAFSSSSAAAEPAHTTI